jgi:hypothetical protein
MIFEAAYQLANLITISVLCSAAAGILGYGWGRESAQQEMADAQASAEAARINRFRSIFHEGVSAKKEAPMGHKSLVR